MLLLALILFGFSGILFSKAFKNRSLLILLLSCIAIGAFSLPSLIFCFMIAFVNYGIIKTALYKTGGLIASICFNFFGLAAFHFYEIFYEEWGIVPILFGAGYLTLQFIDYACKVHFKQAASPQSFIQYTAATLYMPKFFMGPIASLPDLEKEIRIKPQTETQIYAGLNRILLGLFKKLVLAESLAVYVNSVLDFKDTYPGLTILSGACLYGLQLYFDFSGYCDIAIGASVLWNIHLPENFNFPFRQRTWAAFWKSWHSTLTQWLWQYIFIPLYLFFSRKQTNKLLAQGLCIILAFSAMAFFNGIKSGFFISALLYALFYLVELISGERKKTSLSAAFIFLLFSIGLVFFRTPDYSNYSFLAERLTDFKHFLPNDWMRFYFAPIASGGTLQDYFNFSFTLVLCLLFLFFERKIFTLVSKNNINPAFWISVLFLLAIWGVFTSGSRFIYMQF
jgi:D-alanyl-lipoteichoic acid acyltransferase DltB (MBOAT superfamily)